MHYSQKLGVGRMKRKIVCCILALLMLGFAIPSEVSAAGKGYIVIEKSDYLEDNSRAIQYSNLIPMADGGYALYGTNGGQAYVEKYNADGQQQYKSSYSIADAYTRVPTKDNGILVCHKSQLVKLGADGSTSWSKGYTGYNLHSATELAGGQLAAIAYNISLDRIQLLLFASDGTITAEKELTNNGSPFYSLAMNNIKATDDGGMLIFGPLAKAGGDEYGAIKLNAAGNVVFNKEIALADTSESSLSLIATTSDGGFMLRSMKALTKYDAQGNLQWRAASDKYSIQTIVETGEGYLAGGNHTACTIPGRADVLWYFDTVLVRYDKNGRVLEEKIYYEDMESINGLAPLGNGKYAAFATTINNYTQMAQKDNKILKLSINTDPVFIPKNGWEKIDGHWYYFVNGNRVRMWQKDNGSWYYMNVYGAMHTGWHTDYSGSYTGELYYLQPSGRMATGWVKSEGNWFYLSASGPMVTGWIKDNGRWYYLRKDGGAMATGWVNDSGRWYYLSHNGDMQTGWVKSGSSWYYLNPSGEMATGWVKDGNAWYYMKPSGEMVTGRYTIGGRANTFNSSGKWLG